MFTKSTMIRLFMIIFIACMAILFTSNKAEAKVEGTNYMYTKKEVKELSAIIYCEAGDQGYAGMLAVGIVIMNRKNSIAYPNTIKEVIFQKGQFTPTRNGMYKREIKMYKKGAYKKADRKLAKQAAIAALSGERNIKYRGRKIKMNKYLFFSRKLNNAKLRIGEHDFKVRY